MKSFPIIVKKWLRGGKVASLLRNEAGGMCCLGHLAKAYGAKNKEIMGIACPDQVPKVKFPKGIVYRRRLMEHADSSVMRHTDVTKNIIEVNDNSKLTLSERKKKLTALFAKINLKPVFK